jgi:KAP family P-loop domain
MPAKRPATTSTSEAYYDVRDLAAHYGFPEGDGSGQTVGIVNFGKRLDLSRLHEYFLSRGLQLPVVEIVTVDPSEGLPEGHPEDPTQEICVEIVGTIAPLARLVVYEGAPTTQGLVNTINRAAHDGERKLSVLLIVYGWLESELGESTSRLIDQDLQVCALGGTTVVAASGDDSGQKARYPATSPWALAVGGSSLAPAQSDGSAAPARLSDVVWSSTAGGSFGGQSDRYPLPEWQEGLSAQRIDGGVEPIKARAVPDVAAFADTRVQLKLSGQELMLGGTVVAASLWAALIAVIDGLLGRPIGYITPRLYRDRVGVTPVVSGDNGVYLATDGWDPCTGLGVPAGAELLAYLQAETSPTIAEADVSTTSQLVERRVGYVSDDLLGNDSLDFREDVSVLGRLIVAGDIRPPLSIGLFGDWGSGKSFFMHMLSGEVERLAGAARRAATRDPPQKSDYCGQVVQIPFNAWNYVDGNVWAGLVTRIWEALNEHYESRHDGDRRYRQLVAQVAGNEAHAAVVRGKLELKERERGKRQEQLADTDVTISALAASKPGLSRATDQLARTVGAEAASQRINELDDQYKAFSTATGRIRSSWQTLAVGGSWRLRCLALALGVSVLAFGGIGFLTVDPTAGKAAIAIATALATLLVPAFAVGTVAASTMARVLEREEVRQRVAQVEELQRSLDEAEREVDSARAAVHAVTGADGVYALVQDRYLSGDYREHLGVVGLVQRDMKLLSQRLTRVAGGHKPEFEDDPERIILYIDDLDRCPPKLVAQVLQAIHLLLAYPLFVVVVGVDVRWLSQALETEYRDLLTSSNRDGETSMPAHTGAATAQDYLEKIFQLPMWLRPMAGDAFARLVGDLTEPAGAKPEPDIDVSLAASVIVGEPGATGKTAATRSMAATGEPNAISDTTAQSAAKAQTESPDLSAAVLELDDEERSYLARLAPLISTPRVAKRLVNTYRLVRAYKTPPADASAYRELLVLLAIVCSFPAEAPALLGATETASGSWNEFVDSLRPQRSSDAGHSHGAGTADSWRSAAIGALDAAQAARWSSLCDRLKLVPAPDTDVANYRQWLPVAWRYSFIRRPMST